MCYYSQLSSFLPQLLRTITITGTRRSGNQDGNQDGNRDGNSNGNIFYEFFYSQSSVVLGQVPRNIAYYNNNNDNNNIDNNVLMLMTKIFDFTIIESHTINSPTIYNITTTVVVDIKCTTN